MVDTDENLEHIPEGEHTYTRYPWMVRELKNMDLKRKIRNLLIVGALIGGLYVMWSLFSWYFLLAIITGPAWYFWALRHIDREAYILIECRLKGDEFQEGRFSTDTQTNIYQIPPDIWQDAQKYGAPFTVGGRIYICDRFEEATDEEPDRIYFADAPELSNMHFYTRLTLWLELKRKLPRAMHDVAIFRYNIDIVAQERVALILEQMGVIREWLENPSSRISMSSTPKYPKQVKMEASNDAREQVNGNGPGHER